MKILCDFCDKEVASVFCSADEAALCNDCDYKVHRANKLAGKHKRFSLMQTASKESPLCDICQERRALLFCREDRAILCKECDSSIHGANEHAQTHSRFLLTGVRLSASSLHLKTPINGSDVTIQTIPRKFLDPNSSEISNSDSTKGTNFGNDDRNVSEPSLVSTSSISEYLMETIPGWHVEDFLDPPSSSHNVFCKGSEYFFPIWNHSGDMPFWVLEVPTQPHPKFPESLPESGLVVDGFKGFMEANGVKVLRKWNNARFTAPETGRCPVKQSRHSL